MPRKAKVSAFDVFWDWAEIFVFAFFLVIICFTFIFRIANVVGQSMQNTLFEDDKLVISHLFYTPAQDDIVVINSEVLDETIVKRIIATGNQKVVIDYNKGTVSVDGEVIDEPYIKNSFMEDTGLFSSSFYNEENDTYEYNVPFGYVFVMGDNRNNSTDGRAIGFVSTDEIVGRLMFRVYSKQADIGKVD